MINAESGFEAGALFPLMSQSLFALIFCCTLPPVRRGDFFMISEGKSAWAVSQLRKKCDELGRLPQKSDFDPVTLSRIKAFLGPWPRALEAAGLKQSNKR